MLQHPPLARVGKAPRQPLAQSPENVTHGNMHHKLKLFFNLSISSNLDRFALVPRVVQVLNLLEAKVPPTDPVKVENSTKSLGRQARGEKPGHLKSER